MTPEQFLAQMARGQAAPVYLFLGPEGYRRELCRKALIEATLASPERESGWVRHDLDEISLAEVIDDAAAYSLFAPRRILWVTSAESALPKGRAAAEEREGEGAPPPASAGILARYVASPTPGVVLVFQASRYDFQGEDKARLERVRKFYGAVTAQVEFPHFTPPEAARLAAELAGAAKVRMGAAEIEYLVETLGASASRIAVEVEKLRLLVGEGGVVSEGHIAALVPDARETTIFALVAALGRGDRRASLEILDTLVREGEYLPLALSFLATQFRLALVAKEADLSSASHIQNHFTRLGTPMWRARAEQIHQTATVFPKPKMESAIARILDADRDLRSARPDDRVIMEQFVLGLTAETARPPTRPATF